MIPSHNTEIVVEEKELVSSVPFYALRSYIYGKDGIVPKRTLFENDGELGKRRDLLPKAGDLTSFLYNKIGY